MRARTFIKDFLEKSTAPVQAVDVQNMLLEDIKFRMTKKMIRGYLKDELSLRYKKADPITFRHNLHESKLQRQYAAKWYIKFLAEGKRVINVDESVLNQTDKRRRGWFAKDQKNFVSHLERLARINIIAAVSSWGDFYFTINCGKSISRTVLLFLIKLVSHLTDQDPDWRANTVIVLDNAPYHRSRVMTAWCRELKLPLMFLGPYQYSMAPIELMFSFMKNRDLNLGKTRAASK
jgi:hypothetical protein